MDYDSEQEAREREISKLQAEAERTTSTSLGLLVVSIVGLLFAYLKLGPGSAFFLGAGVLFLVAIAFLIVGQLLHIRAALEKIASK